MLGSMSRALFFFGETWHLHKEKVATVAITNYYSLFHLSIFPMFACPHFVEEEKLKNINQKLRNGKKDPRHEITHLDVHEFLKRCATNGLSTEYVMAFKKAQEMREDMNYGPNVRSLHGNTIVDSCSFSFNKTSQVVKRLDILYEQAVQWASINGTDSGIWIPIALDQAKTFFGKKGFYSTWTTEANLTQAENLRECLHKVSIETLYSKNNQLSKD